MAASSDSAQHLSGGGSDGTGAGQAGATPLVAAALDAIPALVLAIDAECRIVYANRRVLELSGREQGELIGRLTGDALRCLGALDAPDGCGSGGRCRTCPTRLAVLETLRNAVSTDRLPVTLWLDSEPRLVMLTSTPLNLDGRTGAVVMLQEESALAATEREELRHREGRRFIEEATINAAMTSLAARLMIARKPGEAARWTLETALAITGSSVGFIDVIGEAGGSATTAAVVDSRPPSATAPNVDEWLAKVRGSSRATGAPVVHEADATADANPRAGAVPRGRSVLLPIMDGPQVIGEIGLAGAPTRYGRRQIELVRRACLLLALELQREAARQTIAEQYAFLNNILESLTHPLYVIEVSSHSVVLANSAARRLGGPNAPTCHALTHDRDTPCCVDDHPCPLREVVATRQPVVAEHTHRHADGSSRQYEIHGYPVFDARGDVVQMIEYTIDITSRRRAETALAKRHRELELVHWILAAAASDMDTTELLQVACERLAAALGVSRVAAALVDADNNRLEVVAEHHDADRDPLLGTRVPCDPATSYHDLIDQRRPLVTADARHDPRLATVREVVTAHRTRALLAVPVASNQGLDGVLLATTVEPHEFAADEVTLALNFAGQIASSLQRRRLGEARQRLEAAIQQTTDSVVITDLAGRITWVNEAFERVSGYSGAEVIGRTPAIVASGHHSRAFYEEMWGRITSGAEWRGRFVNRARDGTLFVEDATITPVRDRDGAITHFLAVKRDVTREVQLEAKYLQAQKLENVGRLVSGVAHDFNNLIGAIQGYCEIGLAEAVPADPTAEVLLEIIGVTARAAELSRRLLALSRRDSSEPRLVRLSDVVEGLGSLMRRLIGEDVTIDITLPGKPPIVLGSRSSLEQVLLNLVVNARDAMPAGGTIAIAVGRRQLLGSDGETRDWAVIEVSDTGAGMSDDVLEHAFEPFFTTKDTDSGTGLGLATCHQIVSDHGGAIDVVSRVGHGTTFVVRLPLAEGDVASGEHATVTPPVRGGRQARILLCEDDAHIRPVIARFLTLFGHEVIAVADGSEAIAAVGALDRPPDLVISDVIMPTMTGPALVQSLRQRWPSLPVLYISGYPADPRCDTGADPLLGKPFQLNALATIVRGLLGT